ncbi:hypothetical protein GTW51_00485 [Aurantimonas aggregata]|uniref:Uncharacterized protein n=1 Tax=Aurantimonas aggregata TaxID=2047720 RepID=A0A6L9MBJ9_9HYPH|nr:hypothetical protein [Aurantimonas aggregata]NDV85173.1 hypothetical protein [Aurantimonas aggregata]
MAEVTNELLFEVLKRLQQEMADIRLDIGEIKSELVSIRGTLVSVQHDIHNNYMVLGRQDVRLDRIDRRLDLRALAEPLAPYDPQT